MNNDEILKTVILRHEQKIFAFALNLAGDRDKAYDLAASGCAEALASLSDSQKESFFLVESCRLIFEKAKDVKRVPLRSDDDFDVSPREKPVLRLVRSAFQTLSFQDKAFVLLRDQMNLGYHEIGQALGIPGVDARSKTLQARSRLRRGMEEILRRER